MIAKKGILTEKNTLIVDNLRKPKNIWISDGSGSFKKINLKTLINLQKNYKKLMNKKAIILGAGPAGLVTGWLLSKVDG